MLIGGHPSWNLTHLPADLGKLNGFSGCIFDVRIAKSIEGPWFKPKFLVSSGVGECTSNPCKDHACQNFASCLSYGSNYR